MDYQSFKKEFELSGLTQKAYAQQAKISPTIVSYYLRRARESAESEVCQLSLWIQNCLLLM